MSLDRSLKSKNTLVRHRNVLSRSERIVALEEQERWRDDQSVFGLPKVAHRKVAAKKAAKEVAAAAAGEAPVEGAAAEGPAAEGKAAAPAKAPPAAKAAAPAGKSEKKAEKK